MSTLRALPIPAVVREKVHLSKHIETSLPVCVLERNMPYQQERSTVEFTAPLFIRDRRQ